LSKIARITQIAQKAEALREKLIGLRRQFHAHPELSGEEAWTANVIAERLRALGLTVQTEAGGHGVVGLLHGQHTGATVAYRADMDALPIQDTLDTPYRSLILGAKHACGHDAHMAIALGVAEILSAMRSDLAGTVKFIFQPAEESLEGAQAMIEAGALDTPKPEAIFALHAFPLPVGQVGVSRDGALAGMEEFHMRLYSPGGDLETLVARTMRALHTLNTVTAPTDLATFNAVIQSMQNSDAHNQTVFLSCWPGSPGTTPRYHILGLVSFPQLALREGMRSQIRHTLDTVAGEAGAAYDLAFTFYNPPAVNNRALVQAVMPTLKTVMGAQNVLTFKTPYPFAHEDFAYYQHHTPGIFLWLGVSNPAKGITGILHQPDFDIDENALIIGTRLMATVLCHHIAVKLTS